MRRFSLTLAIISTVLCLYCIGRIATESDRLASPVLQAVVFALNSFLFFSYWRNVSKAAK